MYFVWRNACSRRALRQIIIIIIYRVLGKLSPIFQVYMKRTAYFNISSTVKQTCDLTNDDQNDLPINHVVQSGFKAGFQGSFVFTILCSDLPSSTCIVVFYYFR